MKMSVQNQLGVSRTDLERMIVIMERNIESDNQEMGEWTELVGLLGRVNPNIAKMKQKYVNISQTRIQKEQQEIAERQEIVAYLHALEDYAPAQQNQVNYGFTVIDSEELPDFQSGKKKFVGAVFETQDEARGYANRLASIDTKGRTYFVFGVNADGSLKGEFYGSGITQKTAKPGSPTEATAIKFTYSTNTYYAKNCENCEAYAITQQDAENRLGGRFRELFDRAGQWVRV